MKSTAKSLLITVLITWSIASYALLFLLGEESTILVLSIVCQLLISVVTVMIGINYFGWRFFDPPITVLSAYSLFYSGGIVIYLIREWLGFWIHPADMVAVTHIGTSGCLIFCCSVIAFNVVYRKRLGSNRVQFQTGTWSPSGIRVATVICILLGYIGTAWMTEGFTVIPFLAGSDSAQVRQKLQETLGQGKGSAYVLITFAFHAPALEFIRNKILQKKQNSVLVVFVSVLPVLLFYTGRSMLLFTILILAFTAAYSASDYKFRQFVAIVPILAFVWVSMLIVRTYGTVVSSDFYRLIIADMLNEMRTLGLVIRQSPMTNLYPIIILTIISQLVPSWAFSIVGLEKATFYQPIGKVIESRFPEFGLNLGFRITFFGEGYLAGGYIGLAVFMILLAFITTKIYVRLRRSGFTPKSYPYVVLATLVPLLISYGVTMLVTVLQIFVVSLFLSFVSKKRS
jgi:hypothetical protein